MNIFNFEYELVNILNKDKTNSRFNVVYGENGNVIHTKKNSYEIIETKNVSLLADVFTNKGKIR